MESNQEVLSAIAKLNTSPSKEARAALYLALQKGSLLLVANTEHLLPGQTITLTERAAFDLMCTQSPAGGRALVAFTDFESMHKRTSQESYIEMPSVDVLKLVLDANFDGLLVNPAGPWAGVPATDIPSLIRGH